MDDYAYAGPYRRDETTAPVTPPHGWPSLSSPSCDPLPWRSPPPPHAAEAPGFVDPRFVPPPQPDGDYARDCYYSRDAWEEPAPPYPYRVRTPASRTPEAESDEDRLAAARACLDLSGKSGGEWGAEAEVYAADGGGPPPGQWGGEPPPPSWLEPRAWAAPEFASAGPPPPPPPPPRRRIQGGGYWGPPPRAGPPPRRPPAPSTGRGARVLLTTSRPPPPPPPPPGRAGGPGGGEASGPPGGGGGGAGDRGEEEEEGTVERKREASSPEAEAEAAAAAAPPAKRKKRPGRKKENGMPRRPLSAYNIFFSEERARILAELPDPSEGGGVKKDDSEQSRPPNDDRNLDNEEKYPFPARQPPPQGPTANSEWGRPPQAPLSTGGSALAPAVQRVLAECHRLSPLGAARSEPEPRRRHRKTHGKITFQDLAKTIGRRWKQLPPQRMERYRELARMDMVRYQEDMEKFQRMDSSCVGVVSPTR